MIPLSSNWCLSKKKVEKKSSEFVYFILDCECTESELEPIK